MIHVDSGGVYGSPCVHAAFKREDVRVGCKRVERLVREAGLVGISPCRKGFTRRDSKAALAPDFVNGDFTVPAPNRLWVTDLTVMPAGEGPLWLCVIRGVFSRRVVAWEASARADVDLVLSSLEYALASREVEPGKLVHHAESLWMWMLIKTECVRGRVFAIRAEVNLALFEYIDGFCDCRRIQKRFGCLSPVEFEEKHYTGQAMAERADLKPCRPSLRS